MSAQAQRYPTYKRATSAILLLMLGMWIAYLLLWPSQGSAARGSGIPVGDVAPDFELKTITGETYKLSDLRGQAVMLNFWASWCSPCRAEMPTLQKAYEEYEAQGFVILAINLNESDIAIRGFQEKYGLTFPIVVDKDDRVSRMYDIVPLPTSYFIDREGIVQAKWTGEIRTDQLRLLLRKIL